ncbi:hypothetical protein RBB79_03515 [Tunturiibacter empetritectus]|uniref:Uncharacterized protein n=1 Tax=Tunturiibacter lichenicola TaxID=2051959 RepID=A0A852VBC7_9BACT|nr:hypothetical protein [Edaphobacter lichenicola]NYF88581.1 hypothetical protein [Edaphobacter lichenicola]
MIVLSHSKSFLCCLWEGTDPNARSAFQIEQNGNGLTLAAWDVRQDAITEHDRRDALFNEYRANGPKGNSPEVTRSIRPHLEAYLRTACPATFPSGTLLGLFYARCEREYGHPSQILNRHKIDELFDLKEDSNRYHHDTNPAWGNRVDQRPRVIGIHLASDIAFTRP